MNKRKLIIIILFGLVTILFPTLVWAESKSSSPPSNIAPYIELKEAQSPAGIYFDFSIGVGFLYFYGLNGNLTPVPASSFSLYQGVNFKKVQQLSYNKTALYEASILKRVKPWLKVGPCFYGQGGINVESFSPVAVSSQGNPAWSSFRSDVQLYAIMLKSFFENPYPLRIKNAVLGSYIGLGVGAGWQSWVNNQLFETIVVNNQMRTTCLSLKNQFSANAVWTADAGLSLQPMTNKMTLMMRFGCKYMAWGQAREIGELKNQDPKLGPLKPVRIKSVYSFSPYIGVRWCF